MYTPQAGIFALGTSSHAYLEFDLKDAKAYQEFAAAISAIREPRTTTGGVNLVIGFRPELWRDIAPQDAPAAVTGFNDAIQGKEGFIMPATQHDALVWMSGSAYDIVFDMARSVIRDLAGCASLREETSSWSYRHDRDLTGFVDGSENPTLLDAPLAALLPQGTPGAAGTVLLLRTDQDEFGTIFRRNIPYGSVDDHGTMFVGFSADQQRLSRMLDSMAGLVTGTRDALTRFTQPLTGSYYFVPCVESLRRLRGDPA
jgi:putative iron-dependent peroxidase